MLRPYISDKRFNPSDRTNDVYLMLKHLEHFTLNSFCPVGSLSVLFVASVRDAHCGPKRFPMSGPREELQPLPGCSQSLQPKRQLQKATLLLHCHLQQRGPQQGWNLQQETLPQSPEVIPGPCACRVQPPTALLPLPERGLRRASQADNCSWLLL